MKLFHNADLYDLDKIYQNGLLPLSETNNCTWSSDKRSDNSKKVVYLFEPKTKKNTFEHYGYALIEVDIDNAKLNKMSDKDSNIDQYNEYVVERVDRKNITNIYVPKVFKNRLKSLFSENLFNFVTWVDFTGYYYNQNSEYLKIDFDIKEKFGKHVSLTVVDKNSFSDFGEKETDEFYPPQISDMRYIFDNDMTENIEIKTYITPDDVKVWQEDIKFVSYDNEKQKLEFMAQVYNDGFRSRFASEQHTYYVDGCVFDKEMLVKDIVSKYSDSLYIFVQERKGQDCGSHYVEKELKSYNYVVEYLLNNTDLILNEDRSYKPTDKKLKTQIEKELRNNLVDYNRVKEILSEVRGSKKRGTDVKLSIDNGECTYLFDETKGQVQKMIDNVDKIDLKLAIFLSGISDYKIYS